MLKWSLSWLFVGLMILSPYLASTAELDGKAIMEKSYEHNMMDFESATAELKMDYIEAGEVVEIRKFRLKAIEVKQDKEELRRVLMTVTDPADEAGTAFLSLEKPGDADDDQWLYMSALKRSFRKGGKSGNSESFMGSEFTYGDLSSKDINKAVHKKLADEKVGPIDCYVVESTPKNPKDEQYSKYITWVSKSTFIPRRIKFFDLKGKYKKVMSAEKTELIDGDHTITQAIVLNKQSGKATRIYITNIDSKVKLDPADFTRERMTKM